MQTNPSTQPKQKRTYVRRSSHLLYHRGESHPRAKITQAIVDEVRRRYFSEPISQTELGRQMGLSQSHVSQIVCNKLWKTPSSS